MGPTSYSSCRAGLLHRGRCAGPVNCCETTPILNAGIQVPSGHPGCRRVPSVLVRLRALITPLAILLVSCSGRVKRSRALRGRNPTRDNPADGASRHLPRYEDAVAGFFLLALEHRSHASKNPRGHRSIARSGVTTTAGLPRAYVTATHAGGCHVVPSRNMAQQRISKRRATATMAVLRRVFLPWQIRSNVARAQAL